MCRAPAPPATTRVWMGGAARAQQPLERRRRRAGPRPTLEPDPAPPQAGQHHLVAGRGGERLVRPDDVQRLAAIERQQHHPPLHAAETGSTARHGTRTTIGRFRPWRRRRGGGGWKSLERPWSARDRSGSMRRVWAAAPLSTAPGAGGGPAQAGVVADHRPGAVAGGGDVDVRRGPLPAPPRSLPRPVARAAPGGTEPWRGAVAGAGNGQHAHHRWLGHPHPGQLSRIPAAGRTAASPARQTGSFRSRLLVSPPATSAAPAPRVTNARFVNAPFFRCSPCRWGRPGLHRGGGGGGRSGGGDWPAPGPGAVPGRKRAGSDAAGGGTPFRVVGVIAGDQPFRPTWDIPCWTGTRMPCTCRSSGSGGCAPGPRRWCTSRRWARGTRICCARRRCSWPTGLELPTAQARAAYVQHLDRQFSGPGGPRYRLRSYQRVDAGSSRPQPTRVAFLSALGGLLLLAGGFSATRLLLTKEVTRRGELGVRRALGASRGALFATQMLEAGLLSLVAAAAGVVLALPLLALFNQVVADADIPARLSGASLRPGGGHGVRGGPGGGAVARLAGVADAAAGWRRAGDDAMTLPSATRSHPAQPRPAAERLVAGGAGAGHRVRHHQLRAAGSGWYQQLATRPSGYDAGDLVMATVHQPADTSCRRGPGPRRRRGHRDPAPGPHARAARSGGGVAGVGGDAGPAREHPGAGVRRRQRGGGTGGGGLDGVHQPGHRRGAGVAAAGRRVPPGPAHRRPDLVTVISRCLRERLFPGDAQVMGRVVRAVDAPPARVVAVIEDVVLRDPWNAHGSCVSIRFGWPPDERESRFLAARPSGTAGPGGGRPDGGAGPDDARSPGADRAVRPERTPSPPAWPAAWW